MNGGENTIKKRWQKKFTADRFKCQTETAFELCTASCARYVSIQQNGRVFIQQLRVAATTPNQRVCRVGDFVR